jgi:hypothetical protein
MPRDLDLKRRLILAGLDVTEVDGWQTRGSEAFRPTGSVHHHTGGALKGVAPSLGVCINGRSDLPGPLCHVFGPREESNRVYLVAAGKANHAGAGGWRGINGNSSVWGLEEEHTGGPNEPVSELRIDRMARVHAAFLFGTSEALMNCQHREWAPGRKPDFIAKFIDADQFRDRIAAHLRRMANPQEDDMTPDDRDWMTAKFNTLADDLTGLIVRQVAGIREGQTDTTEVVEGVLKGLDPKAIAAAIPDTLAEQVADELAERLTG